MTVPPVPVGFEHRQHQRIVKGDGTGNCPAAVVARSEASGFAWSVAARFVGTVPPVKTFAFNPFAVLAMPTAVHCWLTSTFWHSTRSRPP